MKNRLLATLVASVTMLAMAFVANAGQPENDELVFWEYDVDADYVDTLVRDLEYYQDLEVEVFRMTTTLMEDPC